MFNELKETMFKKLKESIMTLKDCQLGGGLNPQCKKSVSLRKKKKKLSPLKYLSVSSIGVIQ